MKTKRGIDYKWVVLSVTTVGMLLSSIDSTVVVIGLPTILNDLHASIIHGIWIITGYTLMLTMLLVVIGRIADLYGRVRLYNLGFVIFTLGSLLCALSRNGEQLVIFRFLQGAGAAFLIANSSAIITDAFPPKELGMGLGTNFMALNVGAIIGYTVGGVIITYLGWRAIFLINLPIGIFGSVWGYLRLKEIKTKPRSEKFDYPGTILYCVALSVTLIALTIGDPLSVRNLLFLSAGILLFVVVIFVELKQQYPTLDLKLFRIRMFAAGNIANFINNLGFNCGPFLRSLYLQLILGYSALKTGIALIPMEIAVFIISPISGRLSDKYGGRWLTCLGLVLNAAALFWFSTLNERSSYPEVLISLLLFGCGRSLFMSPNASSIMSSVPPEKRGIANGIRTTINQTGNVLSVPFSLMLMTFVMPYNRLSQIVNNSQLINSSELPQFLHAINIACLILGVIILIAIIPSLLRGPQKDGSIKVPRN